MSSDVVLTAALRTNLLSLQNTQNLIDQTQERLATGLKINSALDSPQNFFAAEALDNRAGDLSRLLDGIGQSIRVIEEADNGISGLSTLIDQADSIAQAALAEIRSAEGFVNFTGNEDLRSLGANLVDGTIIVDGASDQFAIDVVLADGTSATGQIALTAGDTVDDIVALINGNANIGANRAAGALVRASVGNGGQLQIESLSENAVVRIDEGAANSLTTAGFARLGLDGVVGIETNNGPVTTAAGRDGGTLVAGREIRSAISGAGKVNGAFEASATLDAANYLATGDNIDILLTIDGSQTDLGVVADTDSIQDVIDAVNNSGVSGVTASFDTETGQIVLEAADSVGQIGLALQANTAGDVTSFGFGTGASDGTLTAVGDSFSENFTFVGSSANLAQFQEDFNNVRTQIDGLVADSSYQGINLLTGDDLITVFNEDSSNRLTTDGVDFTSAGLGIAEGDFVSSQAVQTAIDDIFAARQDVRNFGSSIANDLAIIQTRQEFTFQTINTLEAGRDDLVVADQNEEGANLLALQTRQALGVTALSLASQSAQSVLQLF